MKSQAKKTTPGVKRARPPAGRQKHTKIRLDAAHVREMLEAYQRFDLEKERLRIQMARNRTATDAFRSFEGLWKFGRKFGSRPPANQEEKIASIARYYTRLDKLSREPRANKA